MDSSTERSQDRPTHMPTPQVVLVGALILIPIAALMWVSSYAKREPELWGLPFFYWYQFCWVFVTAILTSVAYRVIVSYEDRRGRPPSARGPVEAPDDGVVR